MFSRTTIVFLAIASLIVFSPHRIDAEPLQIITKPTLEQHIERIFGEKAKVAMATFKAESGLKLDAKGYNCMYQKTVIENGKAKIKSFSKSCKKEDRYRAWSVDCGLAQVNVRGQVCPRELLTVEGNMKQVEKIYKSQGMLAWSAYKNGSYKKYL